jgi:hypothetical protein
MNKANNLLQILEQEKTLQLNTTPALTIPVEDTDGLSIKKALTAILTSYLKKHKTIGYTDRDGEKTFEYNPADPKGRVALLVSKLMYYGGYKIV